MCMYISIYLSIYIYTYTHVEREKEREGAREREGESDSCAYLLLSMDIYCSSEYPFFNLWVFATVANTH